MTFLYLNSDRMGTGDDGLGRRLLVAFLEKLAESGVSVDLVGCVNSAVYLTTSEGPALEALRKLHHGGTRVASCGTCLDHFGLRDSLQIGEVGAMDDTVRTMAGADRVIRPC